MLQLQRPFPQTAAALTASGGTLVVVGAGTGASTSTDGLAWTGHLLPRKNLNAVAANGSGLVVAVGDAGVILTTTDFSTFTSITPVTSQSLKGLAYGNGAFVGVGASGAIVRSTDGASWTSASNGTQDLLGITYGGNQFVAVGYGGTILTSPDGVTWTARGAAGVTTQYLVAVGYDSATPRYVAVGAAGVVLTSPDGATWTRQTATGVPASGALRGVAWSGGTYVAAGDFQVNGGGSGLIFTSTDAATWTARDTGLWQEAFLGVVRAGSYFYALGAGGSITRSSDGASWSQVMVPSGAALDTVAYGNGLYVTAGGHDVATFSSPDGVTWTSHFMAGCCGGNFPTVVYGQWTTPKPGQAFVYAAGTTIYTSSDGINWPSAPTYTAPAGSYLVSSAYGAGLFVVVGFNGNGNTGIVFTSPDGMTWTDQTATASMSSQVYALAFGGGKFAATGATNAYYSTDAIHWTPENPQDHNLMATMAYGNGVFVAVDGASGGSDFITSMDAISWTSHHLSGVSLGAGYGISLSFGNGMFLAPSFATSTDGINWTANPVPAGGSLGAAVYSGGKWVGVSGGPILFFTHP